MIAFVFNGNPAFLLDDAPDWSAGCTLDATIPAAFERGLSGRETRRPTGDTLRLEFSYDTVVQGAALTNLRNALQSLNVQPVLCPLWTHPVAAGDVSPIAAAWFALFNADGSFSALQPVAASPFDLDAYPVMIGRLAEIPDPSLLCSDLAHLTFKFIENAAASLTPPAIVGVNGLTDASGAMRPLLPVQMDWSTNPNAAASEVDIERRNIGQVRSTADAYYVQPSRRLLTQSFVLAGGDDLKLLRFWLDRAGERENFWLPAGLVETGLTVNVTAIAATLTVADGAALGDNRAVILNDNQNRVPLAITSIAGNTLNLAAAPGVAFAAGNTILESLVLCRFNALKLSLTYAAPGYATCTSKFIEVSAEVSAVAGETTGTTMGALPTSAILFQFTMTTPSGSTNWFFTGFERDLQGVANVIGAVGGEDLVGAGGDGVGSVAEDDRLWHSAPIEFDTITETSDLKRNETTITSRNFAGNPLALLFPLALEWPLMVKIFEGDVVGNTVTNLRCYFSGEVGGADLEPPYIVAKAATLSHIFDRQLPRRIYQRTDNWCLFEPANCLTPADWQWNAAVVSYDAPSATLVLGTLVQETPANALAAVISSSWFAAGYLVLTSGGKQQVRMIADNTDPVAGHITVYLTTPLTTAPVAGDVLKLFPGYDGQASTARDKFNNYQKGFGGFPFMPVGNPSVLRITAPVGGGKK